MGALITERYYRMKGSESHGVLTRPRQGRCNHQNKWSSRVPPGLFAHTEVWRYLIKMRNLWGTHCCAANGSIAPFMQSKRKKKKPEVNE